jgi:hypothetical protein
VRLIQQKTFLSGMLFIVFAIVLILNALPLSMGTSRNIGPGYFPLALAGLLLLLGIGTVMSGIRRTDEGNAVGQFDWRGTLVVAGAMLAFALCVRPFGFIPALTLATIIASFAPPKISLKRTVIMTPLVVFFSWLIFVKGLGMSVRLFW